MKIIKKNKTVTINKYTQKLNQPGLKFLADGSILQLTLPSSKTDKPAQPQRGGSALAPDSLISL